MFKDDLYAGVKRLKELHFEKPSIYVYPYVYSFPTSDKILKSARFSTIVGSSILRIPIEDLASGIQHPQHIA